MAGDSRIGRWLEVLRREANANNPAQADSWKHMEAVLIAVADGLKRHSAQLAQAWPSEAGRAYQAYLDAIVAPLDGGAIERCAARQRHLRRPQERRMATRLARGRTTKISAARAHLGLR